MKNTNFNQLRKIFDAIGIPEKENWPNGIVLQRNVFISKTPQTIEIFVADMI